MYQYPYGNAQQLNLDWILSKLQEIKSSTEGAADLETVANKLIALTYDSTYQYRRYDYAFYNGKLYRALVDTTGNFSYSDWREVLIGDDIPVLTRLVNAIDASLNALDSDEVDNVSSVTGSTVSAALNTLLSLFGEYFYLGYNNITAIAQNTDYNTLTTAGVYKCSGSADAGTMVNAPTNAYAHKLVVINGNNDTVITQLAVINYQTSGLLARSRRNNGVWGDWHYLVPIRITDTVAAGTTGQTFSHTSVIPSAIVLNAYFSNPKAVGSDVTISTAAGQVTITGTFYEALDVTYYIQ